MIEALRGTSIAIVLAELAAVLRHERKYSDAEQEITRAREIQQAELGEGDPELGLSFENLGLILSEEDEPSRAVPAFEKALALEQRYWVHTIERQCAYGRNSKTRCSLRNSKSSVDEDESRRWPFARGITRCRQTEILRE
jgi:tetratricopeptide (TPR) repeat protein